MSAEPDPFRLNLYRPMRSNGPVRISPADRALQLKVSDDGMELTGHKGYCTARASHGVTYGTWYWEVKVLEPEERPGYPEGHVRLGIAQATCKTISEINYLSPPLGDVQLPCGYDAFSYSWRDKQGTKFHKSKGDVFGPEAGYSAGDVLGFLLELHPRGSAHLLPPRSSQDPVRSTTEGKTWLRMLSA